MFPMEFDHSFLESLPLPTAEGIKRVLKILNTIIMGRLMPYFRNKRGTDTTLLARISDCLRIERLEDEANRIRIASLAFKEDAQWTIQIHERIFDFLSFVMPSDPESRLGGKTSEEGKILAFAELLLRHEIEHILYPQETEREVIRSDVVYAMDRRLNDPAFYGMLRKVLADEMNGLKGEPYPALFDSAEQERTYEYLITRILTSLVIILGDVPGKTLRSLFLYIDTDLKTKVLEECYRRSRDASYSLVKRATCLQEVLHLFALIVDHDEKEAEKAFNAFKDRWVLIYLFNELNLPETSLEGKNPEEIFAFLKDNLKRLSKEKEPPHNTLPKSQGVAAPEPKPPVSPTKNLKDRIEDARNDPTFSRQAMEVITSLIRKGWRIPSGGAVSVFF